MNIEDMLTKKIYSLTKTLDIFQRELNGLCSELNVLRREVKVPTEEEKKNMGKLLINIQSLELKIEDTKKELNKVTDQIVFIMSIDNKTELSQEEQIRLQQLSQINQVDNAVPSYKQDYTNEAEEIRQNFESPLYPDDETPSMGSR